MTMEAGKAVKDALAIEAESAEELEAARAEQERGRSGLSAGLLLQAVEKERQSLQLFEQGIETLQQALEDRRRALDQQEQLLTELVNEMSDGVE
jgi:uncharacterized coiled-coil protein SlyX